MKYIVITIMSLFSAVLLDTSLYSMDEPLAMISVEKSSDKKFLIKQSLQRFNKAFEKTWGCYAAEDDDALTFRICCFSGPADSQKEAISGWIRNDFHDMLWDNGDYGKKLKESWCTDNELEALSYANNNFVKFISNGIEYPICIDQVVVEKKEGSKLGYPVTVLNIDTDTSSLPEELFAKNVEQPMTIVINRALVLNSQVMQNLRDKLESLGECYEAHKVLQELNQFEKEECERLLKDANWPKDLQVEIEQILSGFYLPDVESEKLINLCFFDSLTLDQQREGISYWIKEIWRSEVQSTWYWPHLVFDESRSAIQLISGDAIDSILLTKEREAEDFIPNRVLTILTFNSADDVNHSLPLVANSIKTPLIIGINQALLENKEFVNSLFENLIDLRDKGGALKCLEMLDEKCPNSKYASQAAFFIKAAKEKKIQQNTPNQAPKKERDSNNRRWFGATSIFAHPVAKYVGIIALVGSTMGLLFLLNNYLKSSEKSVVNF